MRRMIFSITFALAAVAAFSLVPAQVSAQTFPDRPVRIVVPFPPGGSNDVVARIVAQKLGVILKGSVIVENHGGAGGNIGADLVARAEPDGLTLLLAAPGPLVVNQTLYAKLNFNPEMDFAPVALIASVPIVLAVNPSVKANNVKELIALAKAEPGKLNFGSSGNGSTNHLAGELLKSTAKIDIVHVPYRGAAPAMNDLIAGQIPMMFDNMPAVRPQAEGGRIRALAIAGKTRSKALPDLPTMSEAGVLGFDASSWFGLVAPAKTPAATLKILTDATDQVLKDPDLAAKFEKLGAEPGTVTGAAFGDFLKAETEKWGKVIKSANIKVNG